MMDRLVDYINERGLLGIEVRVLPGNKIARIYSNGLPMKRLTVNMEDGVGEALVEGTEDELIDMLTTSDIIEEDL